MRGALLRRHVNAAVEDALAAFCGTRGPAPSDEALAIMRLERVASDRLFIDAQFAALPPFKKAKTPRQGKAKKATKAK